MHQSELGFILQLLADKNSTVDVLILCETFLSSKINQLVNIPGYSMISNSRTDHKGGGVAILIRDGITYKKHPDLNVMYEKEVESVYAEVQAKNGRMFVLGSLYRVPNTSETKLIQHIEETVHKVNSEKEKKEIILGMVQNMDLLQSDKHNATESS